MKIKDFYTMLKRVVCALERIADAEESLNAMGREMNGLPAEPSPCKCYPEKCTASQAAQNILNSVEMHTIPVDQDVATHVSLPAIPPPKTPSAKNMERDHLKAILTDRGVKFKDSARTETLEKLVAQSAIAPIKQAEEQQKLAGENWDKPTEAPAITREQAREALMMYAAANGKDAALKVLLEKGGASKLSEVPVENYAAILGGCKNV